MRTVQVELAVPETRTFHTDPTRTALVVVDLENEFCDPRGKEYLGGQAEQAVQASAALIDWLRARGGRIIWVRSVRSPDAIEFTEYGREPFLIAGTWATEFTPPLTVMPGEPVIEKHSHDCFNHTAMDAYLEEQGILPPEWSIVVVGVALGVCVNHAVTGFSVRHYRVAVPLDCVAPREGPHAAATLWCYGIADYALTVTVTTSGLLDLNPAAAGVARKRLPGNSRVASPRH